MSLIYLSRHAHPDRARTDLPYHLPPGPPLTERGEQEAAQLGDFFRRAGIRSIIASPLDRCRRTASIAAEIAGADLQVEPAITEWQPGEKADDIRQRVWPVFEAAFQGSTQAGPIALVTHGGPIGVLLETLGMDRTILLNRYTYDYGNPLPTAGVWRAERENGESVWKLSLDFVPGSSMEKLTVGLN